MAKDADRNPNRNESRYDRRLVVVSNRLPIVVHKTEEGTEIRSGSGGLVTALNPIMERNGGLWIGWAGSRIESIDEEALERFSRDHNYTLRTVSLTPKDVDGYYEGFSNESLWPLFHDLLGRCRFEETNWEIYQDVNRRFAEATQAAIGPDDFVWIHDYHLALVGKYLKEAGVTQPLAYFLHIPFPSPDIFRRLPWRRELLEGLMQYDLLGFQTVHDRRNFVSCVKSLLGPIKVKIEHRTAIVEYEGRVIRAGSFPIGIDFDEFNEFAKSEVVAKEVANFRERFSANHLILGVDRLDYTKGIPERFRAFERALVKYPELMGKVSLFQLVVPSRDHVTEYMSLKGELEQLVGRINGLFSRRGWIPIHYQYGTMDRTQLVACYLACEIALITPLRDGMNLVAKEYCASQISDDGVLIISEFAGTAEQLKHGPIIVNPYDREGLADSIYQAFQMGSDEKAERMKLLREDIRRNDVHRWVRWFIEALEPTPKLVGVGTAKES